MNIAPRNVLEVYADIWCPFAHVGLRRVADRRNALAVDTHLRVHPWPLELVNGKPMDAAFIGEEVVEIREQVAPDLFAHFDESAFPATTLPALALVESAYAMDIDTGERMSLALRDALFEQGRCIDDPAVLAELADALGVPPATDEHAAAVLTSWQHGRDRGVVGSPHFFTSDGNFFCPALDITRVDGHLQMAPKADVFDAFVAAAIGTA